MANLDVGILAERLEALEKENRRLRRRVTAIACLFVAPWLLAVSGASSGKTSEAKEFTVKDANGAAKASLGVDDDGMPLLLLFDDRGNTTAQLAATRRGPALTFYDDKRRPMLALDSFDGTPRLVFFDESGKTRATFGSAAVKNEETGVVEKRPPNSIALYDQNSKLLWEAP